MKKNVLLSSAALLTLLGGLLVGTPAASAGTVAVSASAVATIPTRVTPREATGQYVYTCIPTSGVSYITTKANLKRCDNYIDVTINGNRIAHIKAHDTYLPSLQCYWNAAKSIFSVYESTKKLTIVGVISAIQDLASVGSACDRH